MKQGLQRDFRYPIELDDDLFSHGHRIGRFKTQEIGPTGLFIETGPLSLFSGHSVEVAFCLSSRAVGVAGIIDCRTTAGVGIHFSVVNHALSDALDDLLSITVFSSAGAGYRRIQ